MVMDASPPEDMGRPETRELAQDGGVVGADAQVKGDLPAGSAAADIPVPLDAPARLHPGSMAIWLLPNSPGNLLALPAILAFFSRWDVRWALLGIAVIGVLALAWAVLRWRRFTYMIYPGELVIEDGVFSRNRRTIPLERVQDVGIEQKLLARLFGLAVVRVETGGGQKDEATLASVSLAQAHRLRAILRSGAQAHRTDRAEKVNVGLEVNGEIIRPDDRLLPIFSMSPGRVALFGVFSFSVVWLAVLATILQFAGDALGFGWDELFDLAADAQDKVPDRLPIYLWAVGAVSVVLLGVVSGVVQALQREWGFTLQAGAGRFRRVRGLLTKTEVAVAIRRVQLALIERGPIRRFFGWQGLSLQTLGGSDDAGGRQVLAPFARSYEVAVVMDHAALPVFYRPPLVQVSRVYALRSAIWGVAAAIPIMVAAWWFTPLLWVGSATLAAGLGIAWLAPRFHRYGVQASSLQVMSGVLTQRDWVVPLENIQVVQLAQGPIQRWFNTVSVYPDTAGARGPTPAVEDVSREQGAALARELLAGID